ncbi:hypothetical protein PSN01_05921 [Micromonospora saelicesensis]|nr:hypothetical protein PSN01_05921 [Micromonospora saelicesensis]
MGRRLVGRFGRPSAARRPDRLVGGQPGVRHRPGVVGRGCLRVVAGFGRPVAVRWDAGGRHDRRVPSRGRVVGAGVVGTGRRPGQGRHLGGQRVVGGQVLAAQLTGESQVVVCLGELPAVALHRPEPRQHLDAAGVPVAVHLAVQLPGVLEAVAGHRALAARVLDGGQVGVRGEHPQGLRAILRGQLDDDFLVEPCRPGVAADPVQHRGQSRRRGHRARVGAAVQAGGGRVREGGPSACRVRLAEGDQHPRLEAGRLGQLGGGVGRAGVGVGERVGQQLLCAGQIAGGHEVVRLISQFTEAGRHAPSCSSDDGKYKTRAGVDWSGSGQVVGQGLADPA